MQEFVFTVETLPKAKARPKFVRQGKFIHAYTPKTTLDYERKIAEEFLLQGGTVFDYPFLEISIIAYFPIPKSTRKAERLLLETEFVPYPHKPDTDNLGKSILDALNKVAYMDDKQVVFLKVKKFYGKYPRIHIRIKEIEVDRGDSNGQRVDKPT